MDRLKDILDLIMAVVGLVVDAMIIILLVMAIFVLFALVY